MNSSGALPGTSSTVTARRLLVTTGLVDELPDVPGLAERFGGTVLHCPYCHGWEVRDQPIGVLATGPMAVHQTLLWRQWSDRVTLFAHDAPALGEEEYERLAARGIAVVEGKVTGLTGDPLTGVNLADGRVVPCQVMAVLPRLTARTGLLEGLGLEAVEEEAGSRIDADPYGATRVPGVWVAGNVTALFDTVIGAAAGGVRAAAAINADLAEEDTRRAVEARRGTHEDYWDARYRQSDRIWSGDPNDVLVREADGLAPGRALDLGCGEGADAVWLARRGWRVTATDISGVALERAKRHAAEAGVADRIDWQQHDLAESFPYGVFDLVSAHFFHSERDMPRERILRTAAAAVAPGGVLLVVGHAGFPAWAHHHAPDLHLPTTDEVLESLELPDGQWEVLLSAEHERIQTTPDGTPGTRTDNALKVRRLSAPPSR